MTERNDNVTGGAAGGEWFESRLSRYPALRRAAVATAVVSGLFTAVVCGLLAWNYLHLRVTDPLASPQYEAMKAEVDQAPSDEGARQRLREADVTLRRDYFRRVRLAQVGAYPLLAGAAIFLLSAGAALAARRRVPMPRPAPAPAGGRARRARLGWAVAAAGGLICAVVVAAVCLKGPGYPSDADVARNWPRFRGPGGFGVSAYTNVPQAWDGASGKNIKWKTPVPLPGENSPVVWGDRVFLTGATKSRREVYCFDAGSGKLLWQRPVEGIPGSKAPEPILEDTGYAAPTATTDGRRVFAVFANGDVACFDFDGRRVWARNLGTPVNAYGHAASLLMWHDLLIVPYDQGAETGLSRLMALDAATGATRWSVPRPVPNSWTTPILIRASGGEQIVCSANPWVTAYDPATGAELWRAPVMDGEVAPSPAFDGSNVYVTNKMTKLYCIRTDGRGDVTSTHVKWNASGDTPDIVSPLADEKIVLLVDTFGMLTCFSAADGAQLWQHEYQEAFRSSPTLVGDRIYLMNDKGTMHILAAGAEFKEVASAELGEASNCTPAFLDGRIYIRGKQNLYCISEK